MIARAAFEEYARALNVNIDLMGGAFEELYRLCEGLSAKEAKALIKDAYRRIVREHGAYASAAATQFYREQREAADIGEPYEASAFMPDDEGLLAYDAREATLGAFAPDKTVASLFSTGTQRVMECADFTLAENAMADPARPKWALVPHAGACGWCVMVSSNGFFYASEATAKSQRHPNCKCTPVVDFDVLSPSLEGYDPAALYRRYKDARDAVKDAAWDEWREMPKEERARYARKKGGPPSFDKFLRNKTIAQIDKK